MGYALAAEAILLLHGLFIVFAVAGALACWRWRWLVFVHVPAAAWAALVVTAGWICPLTPIEQSLRELAGQNGYDGSFLEYYLLRLIYPPGLTRPVQIGLGVGVLAVNVALYVGLWRRSAASGRAVNHDA